MSAEQARRGRDLCNVKLEDAKQRLQLLRTKISNKPANYKNSSNDRLIERGESKLITRLTLLFSAYENQAEHKTADVEATPGVAEEAENPVFTHSADYRSIRFNGMSHTLTRNQAAIIKILHEAFQRGTPSVGKSELLAAIESNNVRVQDSFKGSPLWQTLVISGNRRGTYRLNLPARG